MKKEKIIPDHENIKETKALIIDCAGSLIAKYGYAKVTSKSICEKAKVNMAAMSRADMPEHERKDFFMYVDEFQNFATETF